MDQRKIYISTTASDAQETAKWYGLGIEIAEYCTAWNMDEKFKEVHPKVQEEIAGISRRILHAPFNELFPCAIINDMATFEEADIDDGYLDEIRQGDKFTVEGSV